MERIRRRRKRMIRLISLAVLTAAVLAAVFLFQVKKVTVSGNGHYTDQKIAADLSDSFLTRNTLYLMWKYRDGDVPEHMPYLSSLEIRLNSPSSVTVTVTEKTLVGYLDKEQNVYFDQDGTVLEITDELYDDIPVVTGVSVGEVTLYQKLPAESSAQLRTILSLLKLLSYQELTASEIRFSDNMDIIVTVGQVEAMLGQDEYLEEKVANFRAILDSLDGKAGTLHMENFSGKNEAVTFTESQEAVTDGSGTAAGDGAQSGDESGTDGSAQSSDESGTDGSAQSSDGSVTGDGTQTGGTEGEALAGVGSGTGDGTQSGDGSAADEEPYSTTFMVFNSSGTLVYDAQVVNGVVVDSTGTPIDGCTVNEDGNVVDAYWNVIDPATGQLAE